MTTSIPASLKTLIAAAALCAYPISALSQQVRPDPRHQDGPSPGAVAAAAAAATLNTLMPGEHPVAAGQAEHGAASDVTVSLAPVAGHIKVDESVVRLSRAVRIYDSARRLAHPSQLPLLLQNNKVPARVALDPYGNVQAIWLKN